MHSYTKKHTLQDHYKYVHILFVLMVILLTVMCQTVSHVKYDLFNLTLKFKLSNHNGMNNCCLIYERIFIMVYLDIKEIGCESFAFNSVSMWFLR